MKDKSSATDKISFVLNGKPIDPNAKPVAEVIKQEEKPAVGEIKLDIKVGR